MMPLALANIGEEYMIRRVSGNPEVKKHLEDLGFTAGGSITVVSALGGNIIVKVKESRVAISKEMARKGRQAPRRGAHQAPHYGHGYHQGRGDLCP